MFAPIHAFASHAFTPGIFFMLTCLMPFTQPRCREAENMNNEDDKEEGQQSWCERRETRGVAVGGEGRKEKKIRTLRSALWIPYYVQP